MMLPRLYLVVFVLLCGCDVSTDISLESVLGRYDGNRAQHIEVLTIHDNSRYTYRYSDGTGRESHNVGTWELERHINQPGITFNNFIFGHSDYGIKRTPGFWNVAIETTWRGKIQLCIDDDINHCLIKHE